MIPLQAEAGIAILIWLVMMAVFLGMVVWTYNDAKRNSDNSPVLWALVVFFAPLLGLVLYFLLGRNGGY